MHLHALRGRCRQVLADVVRLDGQLAVSAVDEDDELNSARPPEFNERIEGRANRSPRVQHVVDEQDSLIVDRERDLGAPNHRLRAHGVTHEIVAVERDVEGPGPDLVTVDRFERGGNPAGQGHSARPNAHERQIVDTAVALENLVRDAGERTTHPIGVHHDGHGDTSFELAGRGEIDGGRKRPTQSRMRHLFALSQERIKERPEDSTDAQSRAPGSRFSRCYTVAVPFDVDAEVIANTPLSNEYNVVVLAAPDIASRAKPGQFVMLKPRSGYDPLLRRPFSVFELLNGSRHARTSSVTHLSILNKRAGISTSLLYDVRVGQRVACLGPLGQPFTLVDPPTPAWLVAGGVGLAPFAVLAEQLRARNVDVTLFYGARRAEELFYLELFERLGVHLVLATEDGSRGETGRIVAPLDRELAQQALSQRPMVYACGPEGMLAATAKVAARHGCRCEISVERVMGCGLGGCYSCVVLMRDDDGTAHHVRSCLAGPVLDASRICWD